MSPVVRCGYASKKTFSKIVKSSPDKVFRSYRTTKTTYRVCEIRKTVHIIGRMGKMCVLYSPRPLARCGGRRNERFEQGRYPMVLGSRGADRPDCQLPHVRTFPALRGRAGQPGPRAENRERGSTKTHVKNARLRLGIARGPKPKTASPTQRRTPRESGQKLPQNATFGELLDLPQLPARIRLAIAEGVLGRVPTFGAKVVRRGPVFRTWTSPRWPGSPPGVAGFESVPRISTVGAPTLFWR